VAALIEAAATLARLIAEGSLPQPKRGIRFLWPPEMTGTYAWCAEHEAEIQRGRWIAGLNLDMVGADQCQTGSIWELVDVPWPQPHSRTICWSGCASHSSKASDIRRPLSVRVPITTSCRIPAWHSDADADPVAGRVLPYLGRHAG